MAIEQAEEKQITILELVENETKLLLDLASRLDNRFRKGSQAEKEGLRPEHQNVLDEIIERLQINCKELDGVTSFIQTEILNKIS